MNLELARALTALSLLALVAVAGCVSPTDPMGRRYALEESQRRYTNLLRWGDIEKAADFVDPALRQDFLDRAAEFEGIRITDFEIGSMHYDAHDSARVTVTYHGYSVGTFLEHPIREHQEWFREDGSSAWWVRPEIEGIASALGAVTQ
jgi:hypothetical protein